ncbi:GNAT family N-acetyltransferase [Candidatus Saccharibacteria bacterium]|nr:GNAT family N-acetyltransferase [Candidatus Saccharibacteria bacterium]
MAEIRKANLKDASRIAEILVFSKRKNYRNIFNDGIGSFVDLQVYPLVKKYIDEPELLESYYLYDDKIVKGLINIEGTEIKELYVDPFFEGVGIGSKLIDFAIKEYGCKELWVIDQNDRAKEFYKRHGFEMTGETRNVFGTNIPEAKMKIK